MLIKLREKIRTRIDTGRQDNHDYYPCKLPDNIGFLSNTILKLFFSGIKVAKGQTLNLNNLKKEGIVVYVNKYKSYFRYLFYYTRYKQDGLPFPQIGFDYNVFMWQPVSRIFKIFSYHFDHLIHNWTLPDPYLKGHIRRELLSGRSAILSLVEQKGFHRRFIKAKTDPIQYLINMQKSIDRPIFLVPQVMFFNKKPHRSMPNLIDLLFGPKENPGRIRRLIILFRNPGRVFVEKSEPFNLESFLELRKFDIC